MFWLRVQARRREPVSDRYLLLSGGVANMFSSFLEYIPQGSLGRKAREKKGFNEEVTKSFTAQILRGLDYLHSRGILHRVSNVYATVWLLSHTRDVRT